MAKKTKPEPATPPRGKAKARGSPEARPGGPKAGARRVARPAASGPTAALSSRGRMEPPRAGVTVRMYRTGLGDCFLLAFPKGEPRPQKPRDAFYMLIDCGVFYGTPQPDNVPRIRLIAGDITVATGGQVEVKRSGAGVDVAVTAPGRIDLLVITHEHWDHISAFHEDQARHIFEKNDLKKLWMAWTENLSIPLAKDLHDGRRAVRIALTRAMAKMPTKSGGQGMTRSDSPAGDLLKKVLDFFGGPRGDTDGPGRRDDGQASPTGLGARGSSGPGQGPAVSPSGPKKSVRSEEVMEWIRDTYGKGKTEFLHPGDGPIELNGVQDARIYILGPPEDDILIRRYNPTSKTAQVYPKAMAAAVESSFFAPFGVVPMHLDAPAGSEEVAEVCEICLPFDRRYQIPLDRVEEARKRAAKGGTPRPHDKAAHPLFLKHYYAPREAWRRIDHDWLEAAGGFALQLDGATNNTSLAFALEIGPPGTGRVVLFPGDAQVGNWESWFGKVEVAGKACGKDMAWTVEGKTIMADDLLRRTVLYKVGHHGSHNATLRERGLELMGRPDGTGDLVAMLPVDEFVAQVKAGYGQMPLPSLIKDLLIRTGGRLMRNDEDDTAQPAVPFPTNPGVPGAPARLDEFGTKQKTALYIEYTID